MDLDIALQSAMRRLLCVVFHCRSMRRCTFSKSQPTVKGTYPGRRSLRRRCACSLDFWCTRELSKSSACIAIRVDDILPGLIPPSVMPWKMLLLAFSSVSDPEKMTAASQGKFHRVSSLLQQMNDSSTLFSTLSEPFSG